MNKPQNTIVHIDQYEMQFCCTSQCATTYADRLNTRLAEKVVFASKYETPMPSYVIGSKCPNCLQVMG